MTEHAAQTPPLAKHNSARFKGVPVSERLLAFVAAVAMLAPLVVAATLTPSASGHGTHTGLGLPPCTWAEMTGYPCPTCGMTTAFAHATHGHIGQAFTAQPLGALLALMSAVGFWIAFHVAITGSQAGRAAARLFQTPVLWGMLAALLASWGYKLLTWNGL